MSAAAPADRRRRRIGWIAAGALACLSLILGLFQFSGLGWFRSTPPQPADPDWHTNSIGMRLRRLPAGQFEMGSPPGFIEPLLARMKKFPAQGYQPGQLEREMPARQASIDQPFAIGATEVTNAQFQAFVEATSYVTDAERLPAGGWGIAPNGQWTQAKGYSWRNLGQQPRTPEYPAVSISWNDAMAFCQWLTEKEPSAGPRVTYRLPTEAEWEYACRARSTSPWGPAASAAQLGEYAWFVANASGRIQPVAKKAPNAWGLHDMLGNEMEWCLNRYDVNLQDSLPPGDPRNPDSGERRVQRGGAFNDVADLVRPACRYLGHPSSPAHGAFRVVRVVE